MRIGIFADAHDHVDHMRVAVGIFNQMACDLVLFAGDFCSPIVVPPMRKLSCKVVACWGDNDGNRVGIEGGMRIVGPVGEPPFGLRTKDGTRVLITHLPDSIKGLVDDADLIVTAHSHRSSIVQDSRGRLFVNPGELSGWFFRTPSVAIVDTQPMSAQIVRLPDMPVPPVVVDLA
jgi:putative phosphoesterase